MQQQYINCKAFHRTTSKNLCYVAEQFDTPPTLAMVSLKALTLQAQQRPGELAQDPAGKQRRVVDTALDPFSCRQNNAKIKHGGQAIRPRGPGASGHPISSIPHTDNLQDHSTHATFGWTIQDGGGFCGKRVRAGCACSEFPLE